MVTNLKFTKIHGNKSCAAGDVYCKPPRDAMKWRGCLPNLRLSGERKSTCENVRLKRM